MISGISSAHRGEDELIAALALEEGCIITSEPSTR
jgi:hypothetical protein